MPDGVTTVWSEKVIQPPKKKISRSRCWTKANCTGCIREGIEYREDIAQDYYDAFRQHTRPAVMAACSGVPAVLEYLDAQFIIRG